MAEMLRYRWAPGEFLRAWEAGAFDRRVELVDGEVWPVVIGGWHGRTQVRVLRALPDDRFEVTTESLATGSSIPDPDCWVRRADARPAAALSPRLSAWRPEDVLLVVEVSDETVETDLGRKARVYAAGGYERYWVVTREGVYAHEGATGRGYRRRTLYPPGEAVPVGYCDAELAVDALLAPS